MKTNLSEEQLAMLNDCKLYYEYIKVDCRKILYKRAAEINPKIIDSNCCYVGDGVIYDATIVLNDQISHSFLLDASNLSKMMNAEETMLIVVPCSDDKRLHKAAFKSFVFGFEYRNNMTIFDFARDKMSQAKTSDVVWRFYLPDNRQSEKATNRKFFLK